MRLAPEANSREFLSQYCYEQTIRNFAHVNTVDYIQAYYAPNFCHCYGCGKENTRGLQLKSYPKSTRKAVMYYQADEQYSGGYPANVYGGLLAMLMDCHGTASAAYFDLMRQNGELGRTPLRRFVTAHLEINYRHPTPMGSKLVIESELIEASARKVRLSLQIRADDLLCVEGEMVGVAIS